MSASTPTTGAKPLLNVAVGVLLRAGYCLIAKRPEHVHQGGLWEFPGGKVGSGESLQEALDRELNEELGISVSSTGEQFDLVHHYPDRSVRLRVCFVTAFSGEPLGREGQEVRWVELSELANYEFPAANRPVVQRLVSQAG